MQQTQNGEKPIPINSVCEQKNNNKNAKSSKKPEKIEIPAISPSSLGSAEFRKDYCIKYAYLAGGMYRGIASKELVIALANAGLMGFLGTGGRSLNDIEQDIICIQDALKEDQAYGVNLVANLDSPDSEIALIELYLHYSIRCIEAAAFIRITPALVLYRLQGIYKDQHGAVRTKNKVIAKLSRPEVANQFLSPAPMHLVQQLFALGKITPEQVELSQSIFMCDDICVEADSGGHTDRGQPAVLLPAIQTLRDQKVLEHDFAHKPRVGLGGGIGTPNSAAAAFVMGADFILTGSINQCTVEAGTSDLVKHMLQDINVQDTDYAPAGDMFESGAKVQVLKKSVFFAARANKLYQLYQQYDSLHSLPEKIQTQLQDKYFNASFEDVWTQTKQYLLNSNRSQDIERAEHDEKYKMARVFRWYFAQSMKLAFTGSEHARVNFQVHTGPALGAFNQWVKGTELEPWQNRHVDQIAEKLMQDTAALLSKQTQQLITLSHVAG
ncbi:PfaD family polyunsaturated fatty acid/polyketide biosynthesis protein [Pseudoalteromonas luteoviolacea]|uniref:PfaD family polyunsaturated fatty acid/polyketide biosynthesis protein n=1 Tax=Pseudoalteromonas luteoviolacea TaxID=43657 RepID=UPI001B383C94|nr:PfaD family polyunsaturated fatty acid/polyketide biosynthesis protein [Pseudoalteromonas luteoviolacea]MBQ4810063.1 PfaD family polyunsaturated fatty acid/polyketide biosynthesis protein [Pseudoalteromonas luteoviolacea]